MMMIFILLILTFFFTVSSKELYRSIVNPLFIFVFVNMLSIVLSLMMDSFQGYSDTMTLYMAVMFISFFIGIRLGTIPNYEPIQYDPINDDSIICYEYYDKLRKVIFVSSIIYNIALVFYLRNLFSQYTLIQFFANMGEVNRYVQSDDYKSGWFSYIISLGTPLSILILHYARNVKWSKVLAIQIVLCFLHCLSPRRSDLFNFIIVVGFYVLGLMQNSEGENKKEMTRKIIMYGLGISVVFVVIMIVTQQLLGKSSVSSISVLGYDIPPALSDPYIYFASNYPYLDELDARTSLSCEVPFQASLRLLYIILNGFGIIEVDNQTPFALDFMSIGGMPVNTAPLLYYAIKDCGVFFFVIFIILGYISQKAYYASMEQSITNRIFACYVYCLLLLSNRSYLIVYLSFALALFYTLVYHITLRKYRYY